MFGNGASPNTRPKVSKAYSQARELQTLIMDKARDPEVKGAVLSGLARAYKELEELKLRLRMKPAPKPIDVSDKRKQGKPRSGIAES